MGTLCLIKSSLASGMVHFYQRGMALFLTYYWFLALDVAAYNYFRINYKIFLGFNHHFSTLSQIVKRASILTTIYLLVFVLYILQQKDLTNLAD
jgi:hypothetical protein